MESLFYHVVLLVAPILALRVAAMLVNTQAGIRAPSSFRMLTPILLIVLLICVSITSLIAWIFYGLPDFRIAVAGNPIAVFLLLCSAAIWIVPIFRYTQRDWTRLSHEREQRFLPKGDLLQGVAVEIGALMTVNLVIDEEGVHMAARGLEGLGLRPVCVTWGEFTNFQMAEERGQAVLRVALLDGLMLGFFGKTANRIATELRTRRS